MQSPEAVSSVVPRTWCCNPVRLRHHSLQFKRECQIPVNQQARFWLPSFALDRS
jgi:hypothetical protein